MSSSRADDRWSSEAYQRSASFVPQLTNTVFKYLDPQPTDNILDIGCGDGILTAKIAASCKHVTGLDQSRSFVETAQQTVASDHSNSTFHRHDCRQMVSASNSAPFRRESYDKLFSNAAMHWILRDETIRQSFFTDAKALLKPGGCFAFEMGGAGNVAEIHAALNSMLHYQYDQPLEVINAADPWFFPSDTEMRSILETAGFIVEKMELEYRPTPVTKSTYDGGGGLKGWINLMCDDFLVLLSTKDRDQAVSGLCNVVERVVTRAEDGIQYLGYVRLRALARKP
ncbi:MAG: hypothetical protein M1828_005356 [Chrysothrix sp. TS-e1954]|nr:MAG: hypothetical protein M1828_005356 [Chrysothrix sp. TS-e1954]